MDEVKRKGSKMASREQKFSTQCPCGPLHSTMWNTQCTKSSTNTSVKHTVLKKSSTMEKKMSFQANWWQTHLLSRSSWEKRRKSPGWEKHQFDEKSQLQQHSTDLSEEADGGLHISLKLRRALPLNPWHLQILLQSREKSTFAGAGASRWQLDFVRSAAKKWRGGRRKLSPG